MKHITILKQETVDLIAPRNGGVYLDLTLGGGGHSLEILNRLEECTLLCFDLDKRNIEEFKKQLDELSIINFQLSSTSEIKSAENKKVVYLIEDNFAKIKDYLELLKIEKVDGVIADLGWSSDQLDTIAGLSYEDLNAELDMRLSDKFGVRAADLLNALGTRELGEMFKNYADIYGGENDRLVTEIKATRKRKLFNEVKDLTYVINKVYGFEKASGNNKSRKYQIFGKIFQALRIAVNQEYTNLREMFDQAFDALDKNGILAVITFHSGEEKIIREKVEILKEKGLGQIVSKQERNEFIRPTVEELTENLRSRSGKLWGIKKIEHRL